MSDDLRNQWKQFRGLVPAAPQPYTPGLPSGVVAPNVPIGVETALREAAAGSAQQMNRDQIASTFYPNRTNQLKQAIEKMDKLEKLGSGTGPGTDVLNHFRSFLLANTPDALQNLYGTDKEKLKTANFEELKKYLVQYAQGAAAGVGPQTNQGLMTTLTGNPNTELSSIAVSDLLRATLGVERMNHAKVLNWNLNRPKDMTPDQYLDFTTQWATKADPNAYILDMIKPERRAEIYKKYTDPASQANFAKQVQEAEDNSLLDRPK